MFKELDTIFSPTMTFDTPKVYNLLTDPGERENILFPYTWVPEKALPNSRSMRCRNGTSRRSGLTRQTHINRRTEGLDACRNVTILALRPNAH